MSFTWLSSINLVNLITWFKKKTSIVNKVTITYKKWVDNIIFGRKKKKSSLKTQCYFIVNTAPPQNNNKKKKPHQKMVLMPL